MSFLYKARHLFEIPEGYEPWIGMAIGYQGNSIILPEGLKERDLRPRQRKPLEQFVFSGKWGNSSPLVSQAVTSNLV